MDARLAEYLGSIGASAGSLAGWHIQTAQRAGVDVAFVITRFTEIHFVSIAPGRAMSRRNIIEALAPLIAKYGYATTRVPIGETNHRLRELLGFQHTWDDSTYSYWAITKLPYQKGTTPCQSP